MPSAALIHLDYGADGRARCGPAETTLKKIEDTFKEFTTRDDIAIILINQTVPSPHASNPFLVRPRIRLMHEHSHVQVAGEIRHLIENHAKVSELHTGHSFTATFANTPDTICAAAPADTRHLGDSQQGQAVRSDAGFDTVSREVHVWRGLEVVLQLRIG